MIKCSNCGNEIREGTRFCSKCGSRVLEKQEKTLMETLNMEDANTTEQNKKSFYFKKVKMLGRLRYKIIQTEVRNKENKLEIKQNIHRFLRKEKENHLEIKISEIRSLELRTKTDFWDTLYAAVFGVMFLLDITDWGWLLLMAVFLYTGYGKIIDLKMINGLNFEIPVNGLTEDVKQFQEMFRLNS